jgi:hypothetical protein
VPSYSKFPMPGHAHGRHTFTSSLPSESGSWLAGLALFQQLIRTVAREGLLRTAARILQGQWAMASPSKSARGDCCGRRRPWLCHGLLTVESPHAKLHCGIATFNHGGQVPAVRSHVDG